MTGAGLRIEKTFRQGYFSSLGMGKFNDNLRRIQAEKKIPNTELVKRLKVTPSMVSKWRKRTVPQGPTLIELAGLLGVTPDELTGKISTRDPLRHIGTTVRTSEVEPLDQDIESGYEKRGIPIVGDAEASTAGLIVWTDEGVVQADISEYESRAFSDGDKRAIGFRVRGDSMSPRYRPGEIVIAQPRLTARDGDDAIVVLKTGERLLKRVLKRPGGWLLHSENPVYPDIPADDDAIAQMFVVQHRIALRRLR